MDSKTLQVLLEANAIKKVKIIAEGSRVYVQISTTSGDIKAITTVKGVLKTWSTIDAASKWLKGFGLGIMNLDISKWTPNQKSMIS